MWAFYITKYYSDDIGAALRAVDDMSIAFYYAIVIGILGVHKKDFAFRYPCLIEIGITNKKWSVQ